MTVSPPPYSAVVIGCGFIGSEFNEKPAFDDGHTHAASYKMHEKTKLVAVCDANPLRAQEAAAHWECDSYSDVATLLAETKPEIVSISSSTNTHEDILELVLNTPSVKAIICEKPIARDIDLSQKMVDLARAQDVIFAVNYSRRFNEGFNEVKSMLDQGQIGDVRLSTVIYQKGVLNNGSHFIDLLRFFYGEVTAVQAEEDFNANYDADLSCRLEFASGQSAYLHGAPSVGDSFAEIDIIGTKGRIRTEQCGHKILYSPLAPSPLFEGYTDFGPGKNISTGLINFTYNAVQDIVDCVEGKQAAPRCSGEDGVRALEIVNAVIKSARTGNKIEVNQQ